MTGRARRRAAYEAAQTAALLVAIGAGLAATFSGDPARILVGGFAAVALLGWRYPAIRVGLAIVAGLVLMADGLGNRPADRGWIEVALVALVVAAVLGARASGLAMRPFGDEGRTTRVLARPVGVVVSALVLSLLALVGFAVGPDVKIAEDSRADGSSRLPDGGALRPPADDRSATALAPYLGFDQSLNTAARGDLGDEVVLRVEADAPDFWRGQSFDRWDGRAWSRSDSARAISVSRRLGVGSEVDVPVEPLEQRFRVEAPAIGELFAAYRPAVIGLPFRSYAYRPDGSIELLRPLGRGSEYTVTSMRAMVTPEILRRQDPRDTDVPPPERTMQGPVSDRVVRLARRITADAPTTYDAVRAIEGWMADRTEYTTDIPPLPPGADAVDQHLFVDRRGFCVQIATSTAAMLHSLGIPVRVGVGFTPGEPSLLGRSFTVRARDAHAWVEVWFPGVGWQAFDPTADVPLAGEYGTSWWAQVGRLVRRVLVPVLAAAVVACAAIAVWLVRLRRTRVAAPWAADFLRRIEREGRARRRPRDPAETPAAYLRALGAGPIPAPEALAVVSRVVVAAAYGPGEVAAADREAAEAAWAEAAAVPPPRRGVAEVPKREMMVG